MNQVRTHQPCQLQGTRHSEPEDCSRPWHRCGQPREFCHEGMKEPEVTGKGCLTVWAGANMGECSRHRLPGPALGQG